MLRVAVRSLVAGILVALACLAAPAGAQTAALAVSAVVTNLCTVTALPLVFTYDTADVNATTAQTTLSVTCTDAHEIAIDACTNGGGTTSTRQLDLLGTKMNYSLKCTTEGDAQCTGNWGENQGVDTLTGTTGVAVVVTVDGEMPAGQIVPSGSYLDTCTVTLQF